MKRSRTMILVVALLVGACGSKDSYRVLSSSGDGPDEFRIVPTKPLEQPKSYAALPAPTPGGNNRTDLTPKADLIVKLGGSARAMEDRGISNSDSGLVTYAARAGLTEDIRGVTRAEDEEFRNKRGRFTNIRFVKHDIYDRIYKPQRLEQTDEVWRWRRAGARTPAYFVIP